MKLAGETRSHQSVVGGGGKERRERETGVGGEGQQQVWGRRDQGNIGVR